MATVKVKVRSLWQGKVGVNSKHYERALAGNSPIEIVHANEYMLLSPEQVAKPESRSKETFTDRFSKETYYLVYYLWKPTISQQALL